MEDASAKPRCTLARGLTLKTLHVLSIATHLISTIRPGNGKCRYAYPGPCRIFAFVVTIFDRHEELQVAHIGMVCDHLDDIVEGRARSSQHFFQVFESFASA